MAACRAASVCARHCCCSQLSETDYFAIVDAKTAELCAVSCRLGAYFAGATPDQVERLSEFGRMLGVAYQVVDDLIDLAGDQDATGKSLGTDLTQQRPTLPLIRALVELRRSQRATLLQLLQAPPAENGSSRRAVADLLRATNGFDSTVETARELVRCAVELLDLTSHSPSKTTLTNLAETVVASVE
ncbi:MAG: hypothetical protein FJ295_03060 [Planctomycetes bacterium]|nr:hypothetical protein [Planctomycetota bacterium]